MLLLMKLMCFFHDVTESSLLEQTDQNKGVADIFGIGTQILGTIPSEVIIRKECWSLTFSMKITGLA